MTHSYKMHFFHLIWSTKERLPFISDQVQERLYQYMGGIIRQQKRLLIEIGGMSDHVHLLAELSKVDHFSSFIRNLKASSSLWMHKNFPEIYDFAWQEGYGSFSVSYSALEDVKSYIKNQAQHHAHMNFDEEYMKILNRHCIKFDDRFVLG